jgi:hypothetical protein
MLWVSTRRIEWGGKNLLPFLLGRSVKRGKTIAVIAVMSLSFRKGRSLQDQPYRSQFSLPKIINPQ